jgi:hypothetical protein
MPRLPVDGKRVIEHRITLGGKERELLADLVTSYRIDAITGTDSVVEVMADGTKVLAAVATLGALLELFGITDVFDFDDELKAIVMEKKDKVKEKIKENAQETFAEGMDAQSILTSILFPWSAPFRVPKAAAGVVTGTVEDILNG